MLKNSTALILLIACLSRLHAQNNVQEAWVRHNGSGLVPGSDYSTAIAADNSGNVYVTGYGTNVPFGYDYLTVKYTAGGKKVWAAKYNGPGKCDDLPTAMAVDESGNVYVTGSSYVSITDVDYATVKYSSSGAEQWISRYRSSEKLTDEPKALAIDGNGNVYVTGMNIEPITSGSADYVTVKYNPNGAEQWVKRYNGPDNRTDVAVAIAVDALNNVHVTGYSSSGSPGSNASNFATIKYSPAGVEQWIARTSGNSTDQATAIAVDAFGNVYVAGTGNINYGVYITVKYDSAGVQQWQARYRRHLQNVAAGLAIDRLGNV